MILHDGNPRWVERWSFWGYMAPFPPHEEGMSLSISLPDAKRATWSEIADATANSGPISHNDLGELLGELSYSQTSDFGEFGRDMLKPLLDKCNSKPYPPTRSPIERDFCSWLAESIRPLQSRAISPKSLTPDFLVYADAATATWIIDAVIFDPRVFLSRFFLRSPNLIAKRFSTKRLISAASKCTRS